MLNITIGVLLPFVGTTLGAAMVFLLRKEISPFVQKMLLGFASGVMVAAAVWSLLIPSIDIATEQGVIAWPIPLASAASMTAVSPEITILPRCSRINGSQTMHSTNAPLSAAQRASSSPSPPSDIGICITSSCGRTLDHPAAMALATSLARSEFLNESGATTIFITGIPDSIHIYRRQKCRTIHQRVQQHRHRKIAEFQICQLKTDPQQKQSGDPGDKEVTETEK